MVHVCQAMVHVCPSSNITFRTMFRVIGCFALARGVICALPRATMILAGLLIFTPVDRIRSAEGIGRRIRPQVHLEETERSDDSQKEVAPELADSESLELFQGVVVIIIGWGPTFALPQFSVEFVLISHAIMTVSGQEIILFVAEANAASPSEPFDPRYADLHMVAVEG